MFLCNGVYIKIINKSNENDKNRASAWGVWYLEQDILIDQKEGWRNYCCHEYTSEVGDLVPGFVVC